MLVLRHIVGTVVLVATSTSAKSVSTDVPLDTLGRLTGALTTTFTPAPTCLSKHTTRQRWPGGYPDLEVGCQGPGGNECCPDRWAQYRYFSPGVCPSGYQACTLPSTRQRQETTNICCPHNYDCPRNVAYGVCTSPLNTIKTATYTNTRNEIETATWRAVSAEGIQIRFQQTDSDVVPIPTDSFKLPPPPTEEELERERKAAEGGLTTGEKAGIGVGVAVGAALFALGACWGRSRVMEKKKKRVPTMEPAPDRPPAPATATPNEEQVPPPYSKT